MLTDDVPKITDWMQGWGTVVGALASAGALIGTLWLLAHEIRTRREERADSDVAPARLVVATLLDGVRPEADPDTGAMVGPLVRFRWRVTNYGGGPVLDVSGRVTYPRGGLTYSEIDLPIEILDNKPQIRETKVDPQLDWPDNFDLRDASLEIRFTDANGLMWRRVDRLPPVRVHAERSTSVGWPVWLAIGLGALGTVFGVVAIVGYP